MERMAWAVPLLFIPARSRTSGSFMVTAGVFVSGFGRSGLGVSGDAAGDETRAGLLMPGISSCEGCGCAQIGKNANRTSEARARMRLRIALSDGINPE